MQGEIVNLRMQSNFALKILHSGYSDQHCEMAKIIQIYEWTISVTLAKAIVSTISEPDLDLYFTSRKLFHVKCTFGIATKPSQFCAGVEAMVTMRTQTKRLISF